MGKTFRRDWDEGKSKKEKNVGQTVIAAYCLDCKQEFTECPKDHLCPNCGSWLMEVEEGNEAR